MTAGAAPSPGQSGLIEIRAAQPSGKLYPGDNAVLDKWRLRADPSAGTLEFTEDRAFVITPARGLTFGLPSSGRPDAVHTVCLVNYRWRKNFNTGITWRPLFLDGAGRVLGRGRMRDQPRASELWPTRIFEPLRELGIAVTEQNFDTEKAYKEAFPGS
jgi:hypothetical protein